MKQAAIQLRSIRGRLTRAFSLVEVMIVVTILAILAAVVAPSLANANAPLPQTIVSTIEIDLRRASIEAIGRLAPVSMVVSSDRSSWWIAESASLATAIPGTTRVLGSGSLGPFSGYTLDITVDGASPLTGDAVLCSFNSVGARDSLPVTVQLLSPSSKSVSPSTMGGGSQIVWRLDPERTKFIEDEN